MIKLGINGFGRIGRLALREALKRKDIEVVAVNDLQDLEQLAYLFKYDSVHGIYGGDVQIEKNNLIIDGNAIRVTAEANPEHLKWDEVGAKIVLEASGVFKELDSTHKHLTAGAEKVLISSPSKTAPMFVYGVNHTQIKPTDHIISTASCTTGCLAPMAKIIHDELGIVEALMTTVHAMTASQKTVDQASKKNYRLGRAGSANIIPTTTGAAIAVTKVIPELEGKLTGMAFRVPTTNVSVVDLTVRTEKSATYEEVKELFKKAAEEDYKGIVSYTEEPVVSQDFVSDPHLCNFDAGAGIALNDNFFKLIAWYDNEYAYAAKMIELAVYVAKL